MNKEEFDEMLKNKRLSPYKGWKEEWGILPKYQHIERMGHEEVEGILNGSVYITEKVDGANLTVAYLEGPGLIICSRQMVVYTDQTGVHNEFNGAVEYIRNHSRINEIVKMGYILRGEWLVKHSISYNKDVYKKFYLFDVQRMDNFTYLCPEEYEALTKGIDKVPFIKKLINPTMSDIVELVKGGGELGAEQKEGIVIKNYLFTNKWGRITWGKVVCADFKEKNKLTFGTTKHDPPELKFISDNITEKSVLKIIHKIRDEKGSIDIKSMPQVLGMAWYDIFTEELWSFVKKNKVKEFNFADAQKLCISKVRDIALDYFNGVLQ